MAPHELERFMALISHSGECWVWQGARSPKGYGRFATKVANGWRLRRAHRVSYEHFVGPINELLVCHHCDNPSCVNPGHLFLGTAKDNAQDASRKGRVHKGGANVPWTRRITHCKRGHLLDGNNLVKSAANRRVCKACMRLKWVPRKERAAGGEGKE